MTVDRMVMLALMG